MRVAGVSVVFMTDLIAPSPEPRTWEPALSASRAKEYERCPLQYRLHVLDGYREPETRAKALGTVVHAVLEELFALDPSERTPQNARAQVVPQYEAFAAKNPEVAALFANDADREAWLDDARSLIDGYFAIEAPQWIAPAAREQRVTTTTERGVRLLGFIDRVDQAPDGRLRVVDYKTGNQPSSPIKNIDEIFDPNNIRSKHSNYYLQAILYSLIVSRSKRWNPAGHPVSPALLFIKQAPANHYDPTLHIDKHPISDVTVYEEEFLTKLKHTLADIYSPDTPFTPTDDRKKCELCPYRMLCGL